MSKKNIEKRKVEIFNKHYTTLSTKTDIMFAKLLCFEWIVGIFFAVFITPKTWNGDQSSIHLHVYAAIGIGALAALYPMYLTRVHPGNLKNRYFITISQITFSILYTHLTGGRIETHFHIFGSLAFLSFYRDWKTIALATLITTFDHLFRGFYWPQSVYGVLSASTYRALEHSGWVLFEVFFLLTSVRVSLAELWSLADHQSNLELTLSNVEKIVNERTSELQASKELILEQQLALVSTAKMSSLGEMAGGIAHEINTPLAIIQMRAEQLEECAKERDLTKDQALESLRVIQLTVTRISKIISGLRSFARDGKRDNMHKASLVKIIEETFSFCKERFSNYGVQLELKIEPNIPALFEVECRSTEISQVVLNLLNNSFDAIIGLKDKWVRVELLDDGKDILVNVIDSGSGIPKDLQSKIMLPFFTTKEVGKGTGLGLSLSQGIIEAHKGKLFLDNSCANTKFSLVFPKLQEEPSLERKAG